MVMSKGKNHKLVVLLLFFLVFVSLLVRIWPLRTSHWWDETVYLQHAEAIFSQKNNYDEFDFRPPMLSLLIALSYFFVHHQFTASIVVALLGTIGAISIYFLGKELYSETVGILCALFLGLSPFIVTISNWIMTDIPALTFIIIAFYILVIASKKKNNLYYAVSGIVFAVSVLTRFSSIVLIVLIPLYAFLNKVEWKQIKYYFYGFLLAIIPYLVWAQARYGFFLSTFIKANRVVSDMTGDIFFYIFNLPGIYPPIILLGLLLYFGFMAVSSKMSVRKIMNELEVVIRIKSLNKFGRLDIFLILWILIVLIYFSTVPHKEPRYIIPLSVPVYLLSAKGYDLALNNKTARYLSIAMIVIIGVFSFADSFAKLKEPLIEDQITDDIAVAYYLNSLNKSSAVVYANFNYPIYAYYTGMKIVALQEQYQDFYKAFPDNMKEGGFFILYTNVKKEPNKEWLDADKRFQKVREIGEIVIYQYTPQLIQHKSPA